MLHDVGNERLDFNLHQLQVYSTRGGPTSRFATVSLHRSKTGWQIYDLAFTGVSILLSFRQGLREEIEQKGLDELIARLAAS